MVASPPNSSSSAMRALQQQRYSPPCCFTEHIAGTASHSSRSLELPSHRTTWYCLTETSRMSYALVQSRALRWCCGDWCQCSQHSGNVDAHGIALHTISWSSLATLIASNMPSACAGVIEEVEVANNSRKCSNALVHASYKSSMWGQLISL